MWPVGQEIESRATVSEKGTRNAGLCSAPAISQMARPVSRLQESRTRSLSDPMPSAPRLPAVTATASAI